MSEILLRKRFVSDIQISRLRNLIEASYCRSLWFFLVKWRRLLSVPPLTNYDICQERCAIIFLRKLPSVDANTGFINKNQASGSLSQCCLLVKLLDYDYLHQLDFSFQYPFVGQWMVSNNFIFSRDGKKVSNYFEI